jgi:hypothetical protein
VTFGREELEPQLGQSLVQEPARLGVPGVHGMEALLQDPAERGVQGGDHAGGGGVVVGPAAGSGGLPA